VGHAVPTPSSSARIAAQFTAGAKVASAAVIVIGALVIAGWLLRIPFLVRLHPAFAAMKFNTALSLVLLAAAIRLGIGREGSARLPQGLAVAAVAIAAATLLENAAGLDLGIDELVVRDDTASGLPGRTSPATAGCVLALGAAVMGRATAWAGRLALAVALCAHVGVLGYLYGVHDLYAIGPYASVALHTALAIYALAVAIVLAPPRPRGLMRLLASESPGGVLARRLVPAVLVIPAALALLRQWGEQLGLYGTGFGRAILVASNTVVLLALIWSTAARLIRSDEQRRAAESVVRDREAYLAITLASIGDGVITTDERGHIAQMNPVAEQMTGWRSADAAGRPLTEVFEVVDEDSGTPVDNPVERVLRSGVVVGLANHSVLISRDGKRLAIADSGAPIRDADGPIRGVVLVFRDQSEGRAAERLLRDSEARKAAILASAMDAIVTVDSDGVIREANPAAEAMFGTDAAIGVALVDWLAPGPGRDAVARLLTSVEPSVLGARVELTALRDSGEFPVEVSITRIGRDEPATFTVFVRDMTDAHRARADLVRSRDRLRALARVSDACAAVATSYQPLLAQIARTVADIVGDASVVALISDDGDQLATAASAARDPALEPDFNRYFAGLSAPLTTSTSVSATVARTGQPMRVEADPAGVASQADEALRPLLAQVDVHSLAVVPIRVRDTVIGTLLMLRNAPGRGYTDDDVTLLQDLADRAGLAIENARLYVQLEQRVLERTAELEAANQELESFSYSVAHDLRAPLRAISGFSHALLDDAAARLAPEDLRFANQIRDAAHRMGELIDALLDLARISRTEPRRRRVEVSEIARRVVAALHAGHPERDVEVVIADDLVAHADPRLLEIALTNLLGNAWKFTGKRTQARIELGQLPGDRPPVFFVRDNGAGFDPGQADKLFGVFQRLHAAQDFDGTGIGLATVHRIVRRHGGVIWAEAELDRGATFYFTLQSPDKRYRT
jgi:PAS domain S-box-containing protein